MAGLRQHLPHCQVTQLMPMAAARVFKLPMPVLAGALCPTAAPARQPAARLMLVGMQGLLAQKLVQSTAQATSE